MPRKLTTLIYALHQGQVLMMHRRKEPNLGLWTAPGGKIEIHESALECAVRELREETGLTAHRFQLRVIATETSPLPDWQWLMFIYLASEVSGQVTGNHEGELAWIAVDQVLSLPIPQADAIFYPYVMDGSDRLTCLKFEYDSDLNLVRWREE